MRRKRLIEHIVQLHAQGIDKRAIYRALSKKTNNDYAKRLLKEAGLPLTIGDLMRGRQLPESTREKLREAQTGRKASKETVAKMAAAQKGHTVTEATRTKIGTALKGHSVSKQTRKRIGASLRRYHARRKLSLRHWELRTASRHAAWSESLRSN